MDTIELQLQHPVQDMLALYKHQFVSVDRTLELYFSGCSRKCPGCQNEELQTIKPETVYYSPFGIVESLRDYVGIANQVHIVGGEPLEQPRKSFIEMCQLLKAYGFKNIVLFTGYDIPENRITHETPVFKYIDFLKTGAYDETNLNTEKKKEPVLGLVLASNNQKVYKL